MDNKKTVYSFLVIENGKAMFRSTNIEECHETARSLCRNSKSKWPMISVYNETIDVMVCVYVDDANGFRMIM